MNEEVRKVYFKGKELILIGTNHASIVSPILVRKTIENENPDTVCIELDETRYQNYLNENRWEDMDVVQVIKEKKVILLLAQLFYGALQKKMAKLMKSEKAGQDMSQAITSAQESGANIELVDRDIQITLKKMWNSLTFWQRLILPYHVLSSTDLEEEQDLTVLYNSDVVDTAFLSLKEKLPGPYEELVTNRDSYLSMKIKNASGKKIVAVVGRAHLDGIIEKLDQDFDLNKMDTIPPKSWNSKLVSWIFPLLLISLLIWSFVIGFDNGIQQLSIWLLWNSGLAALFTALSLGHPLSILVAFVTAPIGTLSPVLAVGFFVSLTEAWVRKPRVKDFQNIPTDIEHVRTFFKNRALRILLLFVTASLGGMLGNIISGLQIVKNLF
ncbi:TraB/GumN family protein [Carnobacterium maltaromaticum]|uniref:TraB/GumN family protein n=1 Tax=Carnobacterium maltaromaticum TaxID=2751 RepID=UPI00191BA3B4|nr:TraB/GumN family protein [Carnobacterium maltaromaticum]CAD5903218.1 Pheromone shutdown protein [Carnobacterium maltaromaticum]